MKENLFVSSDLAGIAVDEFLSIKYPRIAKGQLRRLIRLGKVEIDGEVLANSKAVRRDSLVSIDLPEDGLPEIQTHPLQVEVLYEDAHVLCVNKPAGLPVEPERWKRQGATLIGAMVARAEQQQGYRPRVVHRLDKETTGVLVLAKDLETERELRRQFAQQKVMKEYLALVEGEVPAAGFVDLSIGPDVKKSGKMRILQGKGSKPARTEYEIAERFRGYTLLKVFPKTGRTHQIRVHMSAIGFPLAVDKVYGSCPGFLLSQIKSDYRRHKGRSERPLMGRLSLHAARIGFQSLNEKTITVECPLPNDFQILLSKLRKYRRAK